MINAFQEKKRIEMAEEHHNSQIAYKYRNYKLLKASFRALNDARLDRKQIEYA